MTQIPNERLTAGCLLGEHPWLKRIRSMVVVHDPHVGRGEPVATVPVHDGVPDLLTDTIWLPLT